MSSVPMAAHSHPLTVLPARTAGGYLRSSRASARRSGQASRGRAALIKYLGSKRRLLPLLGELFSRSGATTALDLFTGTTRVAQELKRRGAHVTAVDTARYAEVFARCSIATDAASVDVDVLDEALARLDRLPGREGYVTRTFCRDARYFQPFNGARIDAIRDAIDAEFAGTPLWPILLTSLVQAADRVDSTTGVQMAFLKQWARRSYRPLELRRPVLLRGSGRALRQDALEAIGSLPPVDLAYLDPPYNQHRYLGNYHVWETLVAWDAPEHYGIACKRAECRDPRTRSPFNSRRAMEPALRTVVEGVRAQVVVLSCSNESWIELDRLVELAAGRGHVEVLAVDSRRYVGAQIGVHGPSGERVGEVSHLRNVEYVLVAGPRATVRDMVGSVAGRMTLPAGG